jgi:WD40 repeat protein
VWDFRTGKTEEKSKWDYTSNNGHDPFPTNPRYIGFTADGRRIILFDADGIRMFGVPSYEPEDRIAFDYPSEQTSLRGIGWNIVGFSVTPDGSRVAVALSDPGNVAGGFVRVYELSSGKVAREWKLSGEVKAIASIALSPDGQRVAVSWLPSEPSSDPEAFIPSGTDNIRVMDVKTGEALTGMSTKYFAGPVLFGPNDTVLTVSMNDDRTGYKYDTIKIWDGRTGKLLREITNPRAGVHYRLALSPDGKLLLGYTGTEKPVENFVTVDTQQFQIWDFASGQALATSPEFGPNKDEIPRIQLSPDGKFVLVWWGNGFAKPFVYAVP